MLARWIRWTVVIQIFTYRVCRSSTEGGSTQILSSKVFQDFDLKCLPTETVSGLVSKRFVSPTGTVDYELTVFCRSIAGPTDPPAIANESNCRYAAKHHPRISSPTKERDCKSGEYVSGFQGTYEGGYRAISLRCCAASNGRQDSRCQTIGPENMATLASNGLRDPAQLRSGCPRNVLTSITVVNGTMTAKFCPLALDSGRYETYCFPDQHYDNFSQNNFLNTPSEQKNGPIEDTDRSQTRGDIQSPNSDSGNNLQTVDTGEQTKYGVSFRIECAYSQALDSIQWRYVNGVDGYDLLYVATCKAVTNEHQEAVRRRVTQFVHPNDTVSISCRNNEALCGIYAIYDRTRLDKRHYAFACCEGSNWHTVSENSKQVVTSVHGHGDARSSITETNGAGAISEMIQSISIEETDGRTNITAIFQSYAYNQQARFSQNENLYE